MTFVAADRSVSPAGDLYLMSPPGLSWALRGRANFRSAAAPPVDALRARVEWLALAEAIESHGGTVAVLGPVDALTGLPYAAECGHVVTTAAAATADGRPMRFLLPRMASPHRRAEREHWGPFAARLGFEVCDPIPEGDAIWEAQGDVAEFRGVTLLFVGGRTNRAGLERVAPFFADTETITLTIREPAFHGNMAVLPLGAADRLLVCSEVLVGDGLERLASRFGRAALLTVTEDEIRNYATNGLPVGRAWLAPSVVPARVRAMVADAGLHVVTLAMGELCEKAGGASRCLVCRVPGAASVGAVPQPHRLATFAAQIRADATRTSRDG